MLWSYIDSGVGGADLAGALGCRCHLGASPDRAFYENMDKILIFRWLGWGRCKVFEGGSSCAGRALVVGPMSRLVSPRTPLELPSERYADRSPIK
jgi:hypothetical protein